VHNLIILIILSYQAEGDKTVFLGRGVVQKFA